MKNILEKWREICSQDHIEHLNIPRTLLFVWGMLILVFQTVALFLSFNLFLHVAGTLWVIIIILSRQYYLIWRRYYSIVWPIIAQVLSIVAAIYIKARCQSLWQVI